VLIRFLASAFVEILPFLCIFNEQKLQNLFGIDAATLVAETGKRLSQFGSQSIFVQCLCLKGIVKNDYVTGIGGAVV
jgi:hypothetical protein